jgi:hypothetical protein
MKPPSVRINHDDTACGLFKVTVGYHEGDTAASLGKSADLVVYVNTGVGSASRSVPEISETAVSTARSFLRKILDETK